MKQITSLSTKSWKVSYSLVNRLMLLVMLLAEIIAFAILTPYFLRLDNLLPVGREIATLGIISIGQTLCILTGGFDLSVGGVAALSGVVAGYMCSTSRLGLPFSVSFITAMLVALAIGLVNGFLIAVVRINPFITTMSMNFILGGAVILITTQAITVNVPAFKIIGATTFGSVNFPLPIVILLFLYALFSFLLKYSTFGRRIYCTGGNVNAAKVAGINTDRIIFATYTISAVLAGFSGIMLASRIATANPSIGSTYAMEAIAATVLGGTALSGGEGNIWGTFLGVLVTGLLSNGLIMIGISQAWRNVATGVVLILAIVLQIVSKKSKWIG